MATEHSRSGDSDSVIIHNAKSATAALDFLKNWIGVIALLIGIGWEAERIVGKIDTAETSADNRFKAAETSSDNRFKAIEKSVDDFKIEIRQKIKDTGSDATTANKDVVELKVKFAALEKDVDKANKDIAENFKIMMTYETKHK